MIVLKKPQIQNDLFDLGADLCRPNMQQDAKADYKPLRMNALQTVRFCYEFDWISVNKNEDWKVVAFSRLEWLKKFGKYERVCLGHCVIVRAAK